MHKNICACQESQFILSKMRGVYFMNKTGFRTFVCSFVFTLSVIVGADRAFFYAPEKTEENLKIPHKNIALFFSQSHPQTFSSQTEPVYKEVLKTPEFKPEELKIAQNIPALPSEYSVSDIPELSDSEEIPLVIEDKPLSEEVLAENEPQKEEVIPDVPLVYAGLENKTEALAGAQEEVFPIEMEKTENLPVELASVEPQLPDLTGKPVIIKANKQIIKIDNLKKHHERLRQKENPEEIKLVDNENDVIPLQNDRKKEKISQESVERPSDNQIASLDGDVSLPEAENQVVEKEPENRQWQTMAEKHHTDSPWIVAKGSKYVKNKKLLSEKFSSESAKKNAEKLLPSKVTDTSKTAKVAVQDNLLIPIPQDLLDEEDLVPDISNDEGKLSPPAKKNKSKVKEKNENSFLDNITSVFSKENRDKAIKNLKEKTNKLMNNEQAKETEEIRPQILPTEIRLSFQPNRAEISGQTLRWIQAFARKAVDEKNVGLEIRIDGSKAFELQQKRLNLLYNILTANDVPYQKINTVFVDREPNSFVVRTVKIVTEKDNKKEDDNWKRYYQKW